MTHARRPKIPEYTRRDEALHLEASAYAARMQAAGQSCPVRRMSGEAADREFRSRIWLARYDAYVAGVHSTRKGQT